MRPPFLLKEEIVEEEEIGRVQINRYSENPGRGGDRLPLPGNTLVVWKFDCLGRSHRHLIDVVNELQRRGVDFGSLHENIDTTTAGGKLVSMSRGSGEFERNVIRRANLCQP